MSLGELNMQEEQAMNSNSSNGWLAQLFNKALDVGGAFANQALAEDKPVQKPATSATKLLAGPLPWIVGGVVLLVVLVVALRK